MHGAAENIAADTNAAVAAFELRFVYLGVTRTSTTSHEDPHLNIHSSTAVNTLNWLH